MSGLETDQMILNHVVQIYYCWRNKKYDSAVQSMYSALSYVHKHLICNESEPNCMKIEEAMMEINQSVHIGDKKSVERVLDLLVSGIRKDEIKSWLTFLKGVVCALCRGIQIHHFYYRLKNCTSQTNSLVFIATQSKSLR